MSSPPYEMCTGFDVSTRSKTSLIRPPRGMTIFGGVASSLLATTSIEPGEDCPISPATAVTSDAVTAPS
jgi:hypothetical protein